MPIRPRVLESFTYSAFREYATFRNERIAIKDTKVLIALWCEQKGIELIDCPLPEVQNGKVAGTTNGQQISIDFIENSAFNHFIFWHEYAHYHLHFTKAGKRLSLDDREREADIFSTYMCGQIFPGHINKFKKFSKANPNIIN